MSDWGEPSPLDALFDGIAWIGRRVRRVANRWLVRRRIAARRGAR